MTIVENCVPFRFRPQSGQDGEGESKVVRVNGCNDSRNQRLLFRGLNGDVEWEGTSER